MSFRITAALAVLAACVLVAGAGAGTQPPKKIDLTDPAAVDSYLRSIGIDPTGVVKQVGLLNYSGPNCPGPGWNCTTSTKAVQIATAGGHNKFQCTPEDDQVAPTDEETNTCVILQAGDDNKAHCQMKDMGESFESQRCVITQTGLRNLAIVDQLIEQRQGATQDASQNAEVTQQEGEKNQSQIHQDVKQDTKDGTVQNQNVQQVAIVYQQTNGSENFSHVHQNQQLSASGAATTQNQNVVALPDCDFEHKPGSDPNACANITQIAGELVGGVVTGPGGKNESHLHQNIHERLKTTASPSTQTQEEPLSGIEAVVDQFNPPDVGTNRKITHQDGRQQAQGGTTQIQIIDPACCGTGTTVGGENNMDNYHKTAMQSASLGAAAEQELSILSDTNHVSEPIEEDSLTWAAVAQLDGSDVCRFHHNASNNEASTNFTFIVDPCVGIQAVTTECASSGAVGEGEGFCTPPPGEDDDIVITDSAPTFGKPIAPPNFGEPSTFDGPIFSGI